MIALALFIIIVAIAFGLVGALVKGLLWLLAIGCVLFVVAILVMGFKVGRRSRRSARRCGAGPDRTAPRPDGGSLEKGCDHGRRRRR
jgi:hypothetical protein